MSSQSSIAMAGVLRVVYFLAMAGVVTAFVVTAITNIYEGPDEEENFGRGLSAQFVDEEQEDYNRNLGIIFSLIGTGVMGAGVLGFKSPLNALRSGP